MAFLKLLLLPLLLLPSGALRVSSRVLATNRLPALVCINCVMLVDVPHCRDSQARQSEQADTWLASTLAAQACSRICQSRWAIEYENPAAEAFKLNHPHAAVWAANCNVILAAAMGKAGQSAFCAASPEVSCLLGLSLSCCSAPVA